MVVRTRVHPRRRFVHRHTSTAQHTEAFVVQNCVAISIAADGKQNKHTHDGTKTTAITLEAVGVEEPDLGDGT